MGPSRWRVIFGVPVVALACAKDPQPTVYPANPDAGLPACTVPASMTPPDETNTWSIGRALLECNGQAIQGDCLADGTDDTCPYFAAGTVTCANQCKADQYGVTYGAAGMAASAGAPTPPLISSCVGVGPTIFGGGTGGAACCPCQ